MKKVMIVDDEIMVRVGMKSIIPWEKYGFQVVADAQNGKEALEKIEHFHPDVVFTDLIMEPMDGFELIRRCKEKYKNIIFVVLSNYNDFENVRRAMKLGAFDYVFKLTVKEENLSTILEEIKKQIPEEKEHPHEIEQMLKSNRQAIKTRIIHMLEEKTYLNLDRIKKELSVLGSDFCMEEPFFVLHFSIDRFDILRKNGQIQDTQLLRFTMDNMITEVLSGEFQVEGFEYSDHELLYLIRMKGVEDYFLVYDKIRLKFQIILEYLENYLNLSISGVLGRQCEDLEELGDILKENKVVLQRRLPEDGGKLYMYNDTARKEIQLIRRYIQEHYAEDISLELAAREVNMSRSYFSHLFKNHMQMAFTDYVNRVRISKACELLHNPEIRIQEISYKVGVLNYNYFSILFKKIVGCSPNKYREKYLNGEDKK